MDKEFLQKELERTSEWIQFADKKTAFIAVYYSAFVGYLVSIKATIFSVLFVSSCLSAYDILILSAVVSIGFGLYHIFYSVFPSLTNGNTNDSLFFFGHVAKLSQGKYKEILFSASENEVSEHLAEQIHTNSQIASKKMYHVRKASQAAFVSAGLVLLIVCFLG